MVLKCNSSEAESHEEGKNALGGQLDALLNLSKRTDLADHIRLEVGNDAHFMDVQIDPRFAKRAANWSLVGSSFAILLFLIELSIIKDPFSKELFRRVSLFGLLATLFSTPFSAYTGWVGVGTRITKPSPAFLVKLLGWALLLVPILFEFYSRVS